MESTKGKKHVSDPISSFPDSRKEMLARDETFIHRDTGHRMDKPINNTHLEDGTGHVEHAKEGVATNTV